MGRRMLGRMLRRGVRLLRSWRMLRLRRRAVVKWVLMGMLRENIKSFV